MLGVKHHRVLVSPVIGEHSCNLANDRLLTYMSIRDVINGHDGTELFCLPLLFAGEETPRTVYISREVAELVLWMPTEGTREGELAAEARAALEHFVMGGSLTVGENPFEKEPGCIMARVHPREAGFFDFRVLDPRPGIRILGCFSEKDVFVALTWDYRESMDDHWDEHVSHCRSEWKRLFGELPPVLGGLDECISYGFRAV